MTVEYRDVLVTTWTEAQLAALGRLVLRQAPFENLRITKEVVGRAMICTIDWDDGTTITIGIEPDGYSHS